MMTMATNNNSEVLEREIEQELANISTTSTMVDIRQKRWDKPVYFKNLDIITQGQSVTTKNIFLPFAYITGYLAVATLVKMAFIKTIASFILFVIPSALFVLIICIVTIIPKYDSNFLSYTLRYVKGLKTRYRKKKEGVVFSGNTATFANGDQLTIFCGQGRINQTSFQSDIITERMSLADARNIIGGATIIKTKAYGDQKFTDQKKNLKDIIRNGTPIQKEKAKLMAQDFRKNMTTEKVEKQYLSFRTTSDEERVEANNYYNRLIREGIFSPELDFDDNKAQEILKKLIMT